MMNATSELNISLQRNLPQLKKVPHHVAIIMDGNRRWAEKNDVPVSLGHLKGAEILLDIVDVAISFGIKVLTAYAFSTENWNRSDAEIRVLMDLLAAYLEEKQDAMVAAGVKLESIGDLTPFPEKVKKVLIAAKKKTQHCDKISLVLALNYGGRDDLRRAVVDIASAYKKGQIRKEDITEDLITSHLDTAPFGDPELLIRTSGEKRLSNFLLWQISYTEVYLTETLWPDFSEKDFFDALLSYEQRKRRLGS